MGKRTYEAARKKLERGKTLSSGGRKASEPTAAQKAHAARVDELLARVLGDAVRRAPQSPTRDDRAVESADE